MRCPHCHEDAGRWGRDDKGHQRYRCKGCGKTFAHRPPCLLAPMRLPLERALLCLRLLLEGCSIRGTERVTGVHRDTVCRLLATVGRGCDELLRRRVRGVAVAGVQTAQIEGFLRMKARTRARKGIDGDDGIGEVSTYLALERQSKLVLAWHLGRGGPRDRALFLGKLARATAGAELPLESLGGGMGANGDELAGALEAAGLPVAEAAGNGRRMCSSHVARGSQTVRTQLRRLARPATAFSRKRENLHAALAFHFAHYNFCRIHGALRYTPAMAAGLTEHLWSLEDLVREALAVAAQAAPAAEAPR